MRRHAGASVWKPVLLVNIFAGRLLGARRVSSPCVTLARLFLFLFFLNAAACEMLMNCGLKMFHPLTQQWTGGWRWSWG